MQQPSYFSDLLSLWAQESDAKGNLNVDIDLRYVVVTNLTSLRTKTQAFSRRDNVTYMKTLGNAAILNKQISRNRLIIPGSKNVRGEVP